MFEQLAQVLSVSSTEVFTKRMSLAGLTGLHVSVTSIGGTIAAATGDDVSVMIMVSNDDENWLYYVHNAEPTPVRTSATLLIAFEAADLGRNKQAAIGSGSTLPQPVRAQYVKFSSKAGDAGTKATFAISANATAG